VICDIKCFSYTVKEYNNVLFIIMHTTHDRVMSKDKKKNYALTTNNIK